jgi:ATP-binding cassette, subfamily B, bacterial MsbA
MKSYLHLLSYIKPHKKLVFWFALFSILTVLFSLVSLVMLVPFLELLFDKTPLVIVKPAFAYSKSYFVDTFYFHLSSQIIHFGKSSALAFFCVVVTVIFLLKNLFRYLALYVLAPLRNHIIYDLRDSMYQRLIQLPVSFFQRENKGDIITKFTSDLSEIEYSIINTLETSIQSPLTIFLFLAAMLTMSTQLTMFVFAMILVMALVIGRIGKSLKKESAEGKEVTGRLTSILDESIYGIKIIQSFFVQNWMFKKFKIENQNYFDTYNRMYRKRDLSSPLTEFLAIIVVCIVLWFGGQIVLSNQGLTASNFIAFMVVFSQLIPPAKSFSSAVYEIKKGMASYERIQTILSEDMVDNRTNCEEIKSFGQKIELKNVHFQYPNTELPVLTNINLSFEKGKKYALVGASGAGKSTMLDLILGFCEANSGELTIDHRPIHHYSLASYRQLFALVTQESILFNDTVENNLGFENISLDKISAALKTGNAADFASKIDGQNIGERGSKLSGGEKQRLTIARAAYRDPEIILMDEATSALDSQNEHEVQAALDILLQNKTSIVIAHRLSTVRNADCIILMDKGSVVAQGSHTELYASSDLYKKMVDLQALV